MRNKPAIQQQLFAENDDLRVRLAQAEEILREMRSGEVDALVVSEVGGAQLFTLKGANQSFRILLEGMSEGALTMTAEGVIVYANRRLAGMLKTPLEKVIGSAVGTWIAPGSQPFLQSLLEKGAGIERHGELSLAASDGTMMPVYLSVSNLPIEGRPDAYCLVTIDLTEHNRIDDIAASERLARELLAAANKSRGELLRVIEGKTRAEKHLVQMEGRYRGLLEAAPDAMVVVNQGGEIVLLNVQAEKQFGYHRDELVGQKVKNIIPHGFAERLVADGLRSTAEALAQQIGTGIELTGRRKDGSDFPIEIMLSPLESAEGILVTAAIRDITARKATENRISRLNRVYAVLSGINTLIVRTGDRQELFDEACRITVEHGKFRLAWIGLLDANGLDVTPMARAGVDEGYLDKIQLTARDGAPDRCEMLTRALRENAVVICNDIDTDPQMARWREEALLRDYRSMVVFPLQFADKVLGFLLLYASEKDFFDIEEMKLLTELANDIAFAIDHIDKQERLHYLAYYDVLTGLANHTLFLDRVAQYIRSAVNGGHKLAVFLIDLERFKNINDSLGRPAGDELLRQVAQWLTRYAAGDANLVARMGADHFAAVIPEVKQEGDVMQLLEKWMEALLEHPFRLNDAVFRIGHKVGVAVFPDDGTDAETLFRNAEAALKQAKASGERYLFYTQKMADAMAGKLTLENQLRQALDNGEFVLHYQPKVNLVSGKVTSAEALIRWNDPRTGLVPPGRFIPVLEETGLIYEVGRWALRKAIEDTLRWRNAGLPVVRIAVNVSPLQLRNRGFIAEIAQVIGVDANAAAGLELEITESLIMENVKHNIASLQAIRAMGVTIAIDDFGTGFSSLSYLAKLPVDTLKIDRSFVIDMTTGPEGLALVSTIINLAHSLKQKVVAEGVETEEQSHLLRLLSCDEMQGFLFSKPVPGEIFETKFLTLPPAEEQVMIRRNARACPQPNPTQPNPTQPNPTQPNPTQPNPTQPNPTQLLAENEDLRVRLAQTEDALHEMRSGEVDALFVSGVGGAQLFTLKDTDQSFRVLVEEMSEGALTMTAEGVIVYANRHLAGMLKTPLEKVIGSAVGTWIAPGSQPFLQSLLEKGAGIERHGELSLAASDGTMMPVYLSVSNLPIEGRPDAYCLVAIDLTERKRIEDQEHQMAFFDLLTKLPNRRMLNDRLSQAMSASNRSGGFGALMFLDLDNFKSLNDTHGHEVGDLLLAEVAVRLKRCVREMDTVARFGGDEFVVMVSELSVDGSNSAKRAGIVAEKIRTALAKPYVLRVQHEGNAERTVEHHCTASIGVTLFNKHNASQENILKWADAAMYQAKKAGGDSIRFYASQACVPA